MIRKRKLQYPSDDFILEQKNVKNGKKVFVIQSIVFLSCCVVIGRSWGSIFAFFSKIGGTISRGTMNVISSSIGDKPILDSSGNLNIAMMGYGGLGHDGSFLTDAIIITSINPEKGTMAMLSIPRDLYVKKTNGSYGKINSIFESALYQHKQDYDIAAPSMLSKLTEITGIPLHYYAFIDFKGFEQFVDTLGGVEVDVPEPVYDSAYPGANNSYIIFSIGSGKQVLNGETALKYARSRHSTSDYSRSLRQQAIIQAIIDKIISTSTFLNPSKMKALYTSATSFVRTNISAGEILRGLPFASSLKHKSSWQIAACGSNRRQTAQAGCLLYSPSMDDFGGMSVQLPGGATPSNVGNYSYIKSFVQDTVLNNSFLEEQPTIRVLNGINTGNNAKLRLVPIANNTAVDLIKAGFTIYDIGNAPTPQVQTTIVTNGTGWIASLAKLQALFPDATITTTGTSSIDGPSITLTVGDDYLSGNDTDKNTLPLYLKY